MYVYKITHVGSGKCYIGQSIQNNNIRLNNHRYALRKGTHYNKYLQSAWNKYGETEFTLEKIKLVSTIEELDAAETKYVKKYKSTNRNFGYNVFGGGHHNHSVPQETRDRIGNANRGNRHTKKQIYKWALEKRTNKYSSHILSPTGRRHKVVNIKEFSRKHNLDRRNLMKVLGGNAWHVKGWRLPETPEEYTQPGYLTFKKQSKLVGIQLMGPDKQVYTIDGPLANFCRNHGIRPAKIRLVIRKKQKIHRGWTIK